MMKIFLRRFAGVILSVILSHCFNVTVAQKDGAVRLAGADFNHTNEGRVEIYHDNRWGTVCGRGWSMDEAVVVCNQLGLKDVLDAKHDFHAGTGPILSGVSCHGREDTLLNCHHDWDDISCSHDDDVGVICHHGEYEQEGLQIWEIALIIVGCFVACCVFVKIMDIIRSDGEEEEKGLEPFEYNRVQTKNISVQIAMRQEAAKEETKEVPEETGRNNDVLEETSTKGVLEEAGRTEDVPEKIGYTNEVFEKEEDNKYNKAVGVETNE